MSNQYSKNTRKICCNECNRVLTNMELSVYDLQWRYSGDMYCVRHETREQFTEQYPAQVLSYTSYAFMSRKLYAIGKPYQGGYKRMTAWYDTRKEAWEQYHEHLELYRKHSDLVDYETAVNTAGNRWDSHE